MDLYRVPLSAPPACSAPMRCGAGSSTAQTRSSPANRDRTVRFFVSKGCVRFSRSTARRSWRGSTLVIVVSVQGPDVPRYRV